MKKDTTFTYTYSATKNKEIEEIISEFPLLQVSSLVRGYLSSVWLQFLEIPLY